MHVGWFKFHRQIFDNPICTKDSEYFFVWCYILTEAKYEEGERVWFKNKEITLSRGQLLKTTTQIAQDLKIKEMKVYRILKSFENEKQIVKQSSNKNTLITVLNWEKYQSNEKQNENQMKNECKTNEKRVKNECKTDVKPMKDQCKTDVEPSYYDKEIKNERNKEDEELKKEKKERTEEYKRIVEYLNRKCGTRYRYQTTNTQKSIHARFAEGYTKEDFYTVIDKKCAEWIGTEHEKYLRPETLFGTKFEAYLNQRIVKNNRQGYGNSREEQFSSLMEQIRRDEENDG